jgi:hypothetical protein
VGSDGGAHGLVHFLEVGEGATLASLVCENLAQIDEVANVVRSVGPMIVINPLPDGAQLSSRWSARYASVLADDPGSAVCGRGGKQDIPVMMGRRRREDVTLDSP